MAVLGVLLILIALIVAGAGLWVASSAGAQASTVEMFNNTLSLTPLTMMLMGAAAVLLLLLGIWLMTSAGKRRYRTHRERRDLEKQQRAQEKELEKTRAELAKKDRAADRHDERAVGHDDRAVGRGDHDLRRDDHAVGRDERDLRHEERVVGRDDDRIGHGAREDGTYDRGAHSGGLREAGGSGLTREEEVRRAAERRRDGGI
ncbi:hypothetical protein [Agilicoccus flavus]|uniref:hypothetical protein n=1 Tax=Agilicoccus flavus TaxID=2775968 RepID=UPI001CF68AF6|nr:hypothetical protein [Agilicoccus flavus]